MEEEKFYWKHWIYYRLTLDFIVMWMHPQPLDRDILNDGIATLRWVFPETIVDWKFDTNYCRWTIEYIPYKCKNKKSPN